MGILFSEEEFGIFNKANSSTPLKHSGGKGCGGSSILKRVGQNRIQTWHMITTWDATRSLHLGRSIHGTHKTSPLLVVVVVVVVVLLLLLVARVLLLLRKPLLLLLLLLLLVHAIL
jgi:hypothetical protein